MTNIAKRQYVLSSHPLILEDMQEYRLDGKYLYTHRELNMGLWQTADGKNVVLLGNAFCTDARDKEAKTDIENFRGDDLLVATRYWTGRWVLITETELFADAAGLMNVFYTEDNGEWIITSSVALLAKMTGKASRVLMKEAGLNWQILPGCLTEGGKTLLCTQRLVFASGLTVKAKNWMEDRRTMTTEEKCRTVAECLTIGLYNAYRFGGRELVLALTGGKDSRVTFGALLKAGVPFTCYTAQHPNISSSDITIPKDMTKHFAIPYVYIRSGTWDKAKAKDYISFTGGNSKGADMGFYARGQFEKLPKDALVIRSGLYEAGQTYGRSVAAEKSFARDMQTYYKDLSADSFQKNAFAGWLQTVEENPIPFVDIRDRFYIEQRVGGWAAAIEQSLDMNDFVSIQIANCAELLSVLLSCNKNERKELALSYETIKILEPRLLSFPINKATLRDKLKRIVNILRNPVAKLRNYLHKK